MTQQVNSIKVYWDTQDPSNEGWAYRFGDGNQDIESGSLDSCGPDDLDSAIENAIHLSGLRDVTADMFAVERGVDGGYAFWDRVE